MSVSTNKNNLILNGSLIPKEAVNPFSPPLDYSHFQCYSIVFSCCFSIWWRDESSENKNMYASGKEIDHLVANVKENF